QQILQPFSNIKTHVFLAQASKLEEADKELKAMLTPELIENILNLVPDSWLYENGTPAEMREVYKQFLDQRIAQSHVFLNEAQHARAALI
ncbi:MAG TPA: aminotransferase class I and II, partial [Chitinophagaceae bacterium]|nr:aminotransferase class I and II [Chitinophagaceae bacterium]